jgi:hypothetical protein
VFFRLPIFCLLSAFSVSSAAAGIRCEGEYPYHPQGVATDGTNLYWSFTTVLVKTDRTGRVLAVRHELGEHLGDLCCKDGLVYGGINRGRRAGARKGDEVWAFDPQTLATRHRFPTPEAVFCNNGLEWAADRFWVISSAPRQSRYNFLFEYTADFRFRTCRLIESGWTNLGVQTICRFGDQLLFGCYGARDDAVSPHPDTTFAVDLRALSSPDAAGRVVPCAQRAALSTACGMLALDGRLWALRSIRLSPPEERARQRWTASLSPAAWPPKGPESFSGR